MNTMTRDITEQIKTKLISLINIVDAIAPIINTRIMMTATKAPASEHP